MNSSDLAYKKILEDRINEINESISKLKKSDEKVFALHTQIESKINGLLIEQEKLKKELDEYSKRDELSSGRENVISYYNNKYEEKNEKQNEYQKRIDELKDLKKGVSGRYANKVIDKRIKRLEEKVDGLKKKKGKIINSQKRIMYPKYKYQLNKQKRMSYQEGKIKNYESMIKDTEALRNSLNEKSVFSPLANKIYDRKEAKYQRKIDKANEVINKIQNKKGKAHLKGARRITIKNKIANKLRNMADRLSPPPVPAM